jgi:hypothetical protein
VAGSLEVISYSRRIRSNNGRYLGPGELEMSLKIQVSPRKEVVATWSYLRTLLERKCKNKLPPPSMNKVFPV